MENDTDSYFLKRKERAGIAVGVKKRSYGDINSHFHCQPCSEQFPLYLFFDFLTGLSNSATSW